MKWVLRIVGGLLLTIVLALGGVYVAGHREGAGHAQSVSELQASPDQIWLWLNEGAKLRQWVSWLVETRDWEPAAGPGAKRVWVMKDENNGGALMRIDGTCSEYTPPVRLTVELSSAGAFDGRLSYQLTDLGNGRTRMEVSSEYHFSNAFAQFMEPLITPAAKKKMVADMAHLKSLVEGH